MFKGNHRAILQCSKIISATSSTDDSTVRAPSWAEKGRSRSKHEIATKLTAPNTVCYDVTGSPEQLRKTSTNNLCTQDNLMRLPCAFNIVL
ncbi:hypothetical protein NX059_010201 [Plenodomus lindquistii]|nr:hypothetical protein NX059_010201 [Plenodomus lindquistii]